MSAELGTSDDPRALVPGDPVGVAADARALAGRATAVARTGQALRRIGTGAWTGPASDAWREHHDEDAVRWMRGADSLDAAARALSGHADTLRWAQSEAARAVARWRAGETATAGAERRAAAEILAAARDELQRSGDRVASVLRGEAVLAPRDSQKQVDADFYGGIRDSLSGAAQGAWTVVTNPAEAVAGVVRAAADPVDTAKDAIAYDDWAGGREPRALGRNTGDLVLGLATLGAGKIASVLGRETRVAGEPEPVNGSAEPAPDAPASIARGAEARSEAVRGIVLDSDGRPHGVEDSKNIFMIDASKLAAMRQDFHRQLGRPDSSDATDRGERETWIIDDDPKTTVTYRSFSSSGGATIDVNKVEGAPPRRFHVGGGAE